MKRKATMYLLVGVMIVTLVSYATVVAAGVAMEKAMSPFNDDTHLAQFSSERDDA